MPEATPQDWHPGRLMASRAQSLPLRELCPPHQGDPAPCPSAWRPGSSRLAYKTISSDWGCFKRVVWVLFVLKLSMADAFCHRNAQKKKEERPQDHQARAAWVWLCPVLRRAGSWQPGNQREGPGERGPGVGHTGNQKQTGTARPAWRWGGSAAHLAGGVPRLPPTWRGRAQPARKEQRPSRPGSLTGGCPSPPDGSSSRANRDARSRSSRRWPG